MEFLDARRLTGPSLHFDDPAAVLDVECRKEEADLLFPAWQAAVHALLVEFDWPEPRFSRIDVSGGVSLAFTVPIDGLYAASEITEGACAVAMAGLSGGAAPDADAILSAARAAYADERSPELLMLEQRAAHEGVTFLWDDDAVSLGLGSGSRTWPRDSLPDPESLDWQGFRDVPVGLVTGTNGKTTTVRIAQHILQAGSGSVGLSSTDWIAIDDRVIDRGDWSGPGGARAVLREQAVDVAILEAARGGLLRRGLGVSHATAALITNISEDHLGDFGSRSLDELLDIKWIVSRAVREQGTLVLNADDERLVARASDYSGRLVWFSLDAGNRVVHRHVDRGGDAWILDGQDLVHRHAAGDERLCADRDLPISLGGAARHNVANALAAGALTHSMGADYAMITGGWRSMTQADNPGRCNVFRAGDRTVLLDFAHNPRAMRALFDMARSLPGKRRALCFGQAGDRPDPLIRQMTRDAWSIGLDRIYISELAKYYRGRGAGEVYAVIRDELLALGADPAIIEHHDEESESLAAAMDWAKGGDLVIMLALGSAAEIHAQLRDLTPGTG
jgi:UDP-N-acetylmuramyl tripeptide synthase